MPTTQSSFTPQLLPSSPSIADVHSVAPQYETIVATVMDHVVTRSENSLYAGLADTKFDIITGDDFPHDAPHGPQTVYGWIQGRALEAFVQHSTWLQDNPAVDSSRTLATRLDALIGRGVEKLQQMRRVNAGHLYFFMQPTGRAFHFDAEGKRIPHTLTADSAYSFSDLFGSRGLYAAAVHVGDTTLQADALAYCSAVEKAVWQGQFISDQQPLPPAAPPALQRGKVSHAPFTIMLATPHLLALGENNPLLLNKGLAMMDHVLTYHYNAGRDGRWHSDDFWEFVNEKGNVWLEGDVALCDPGHTLELVGLGLKLVDAARRHGMDDDLWQQTGRTLLSLIKPTFDLGFQPHIGGIVKGVDLITRQPVDATMPWWSLPETMRAAIYGWALADNDDDKQQCLQVFAKCHNAFLTHYILPERHLFAVQNRGPDGQVVRTVPATADADPGYHTGLSLLDVLAVIEDHGGRAKKA